MPAGTTMPQWARLRCHVASAVMILAGAGLSVMVSAPHAGADTAPMSGSPGSPGGAGTPATAYVVNNVSDTVTPIETATDTAGPPIRVGHDPSDIAITPDGKTAYVTNQGSDTVTPIATATNTAGPPIPAGSGPAVIAITPDGKTAYVTNSGSDTVTPIDDRHQHRRPADPGRARAGGHRDHARQQDRLRRQLRLGHGDPDRDRH